MTIYPILAITTVSLSCFAQDQTGAKALFFDSSSGVTLHSSGQAPIARNSSPTPSGTIQAAKAAPAAEGEVTGLRYWIEVQTEQGQLLRVNSSRMFRSGERIRIHVESNVDGSLVILQSQDSGPFTRLFPTGVSAGEVERLKDQVLPSKAGWFRFDSKPGDLRLMMLVRTNISPASNPSVPSNPNSPAPAAQLSKVQLTPPENPTAPSASELVDQEARLRAEMERLRGSKALFVEEDTQSAQPASYVVVDRRKDSSIDAGVVAIEIKLSHR